VMKWTMNCNWKFPSDNTPDFYHGGISHASAFLSGWQQSRRKPGDNGTYQPGVTIISEYGHGLAAPELTEMRRQGFTEDNAVNRWRNDPERLARLGPIGSTLGGSMLNVFPNLFVPSGSRQVGIRMPKGPTKTEIWYFTFVDDDSEYEVQQAHRKQSGRTFGASGMLEQDDGENWDQSTRGVRGVVSGRYPLNYTMGKGHGEMIRDEQGPPRIDGLRSEHGQLWTYRAWSEWMAADSWADLKANHSRLPDRL